jgi:outer membrane protein
MKPMRRGNLCRYFFIVVLPIAVIPAVLGQSPQNKTVLTLSQAETLALQNHPRIASADLRAGALTKVIDEAKSAYYPTVEGNLTGTLVADPGTAIAAGYLSTSSISNRLAAGTSLLQMVTDFGRTSALVHTARFQAKAQGQAAMETREQIILGVRQAYFAVLGSEAVLKATREALENRQLTLRQVTALQQSQLKSTLDVTFAQVLESEAELAVYRAENTVHESRAQLGAAIGEQQSVNGALVDKPLPAALDPDVETFVALAEQQRPDLLALDSSRNAAHQYATAEKDLRNPTINILAAAGEIPEHDHTLHDNYATAGVNVNVPLFTGGLLKARRAEAGLQAEAEDKDVEDLKVQIAREVREAWFEANDTFLRLDVTARLVAETRTALRLAQARYDNGLGSIVELNEAQLNETSAEIEAASAKYDYLGTRADLDYTTGSLP